MAGFFGRFAQRADAKNVGAQFLKLERALLSDMRLLQMRFIGPGSVERINAAARKAIENHEKLIDELAAQNAPRDEIAKTVLSAIHLLDQAQSTPSVAYVSMRMAPLLASKAVTSQGFSRRFMGEFWDRIAINYRLAISHSLKTKEFDMWCKEYSVPQNRQTGEITPKEGRIKNGHGIDILIASRLTGTLYTINSNGNIMAEKLGLVFRVAGFFRKHGFAEKIEEKAREKIRRQTRGPDDDSSGKWNLPQPPVPSDNGNGVRPRTPEFA